MLFAVCFAQYLLASAWARARPIYIQSDSEASPRVSGSNPSVCFLTRELFDVDFVGLAFASALVSPVLHFATSVPTGFRCLGGLLLRRPICAVLTPTDGLASGAFTFPF